MVVVSTASPFKFPGSVLKAFNVESESLIDLSVKFNLEIPKQINYPVFLKEVISKEEASVLIRGVIQCLK